MAKENWGYVQSPMAGMDTNDVGSAIRSLEEAAIHLGGVFGEFRSQKRVAFRSLTVHFGPLKVWRLVLTVTAADSGEIFRTYSEARDIKRAFSELVEKFERGDFLPE